MKVLVTCLEMIKKNCENRDQCMGCVFNDSERACMFWPSDQNEGTTPCDWDIHALVERIKNEK